MAGDVRIGLILGSAGVPGTPDHHLSVDGMTPVGPNLSHWPGNRTPRCWKADLSTAICLRFARADAAEQQAFLAGATVVLNDHYDTDGFGSLLAVLRPELAFAHEELLLAAAGTGDFGTFHTWRGFAIDRAIANLAHDRSPVAAEFRGLQGPSKALARYQWLLAHAEALLTRIEDFAPLYQGELDLVRRQLDAGLRGAVLRREHRELGFAVLATDGPAHRMTLNTLAGAFRVLHVQRDADGIRYRYHDRTESWFELVTIRPPLRRDLRPVAAALGEREPQRDGARWCADPPTEPIPELYFGLPAAQEYGQVTRELRPSRLPPEVVEAELARHFAASRSA